MLGRALRVLFQLGVKCDILVCQEVGNNSFNFSKDKVHAGFFATCEAI